MILLESFNDMNGFNRLIQPIPDIPEPRNSQIQVNSVAMSN